MLGAVKLYEMGRLSSGCAVELAGVSRVEFLLSLNRYKVLPFAAELDDLENSRVQSFQQYIPLKTLLSEADPMISRRDFVKFALTSLGAFLASCLPQGLRDPAPTPTTAATNTPLPPPLATPLLMNTPAPTASSTPALTPMPIKIPCFRLLTPESRATLQTIGKVTFSWQPMPGAARYHLQITLPGGKLLAIDTPTTSITRYADNFLESGV